MQIVCFGSVRLSQKPNKTLKENTTAIGSVDGTVTRSPSNLSGFTSQLVGLNNGVLGQRQICGQADTVFPFLAKG